MSLSLSIAQPGNDISLAKGPRVTLYLLLLMVVAFFVWAHFAVLEEITLGQGKVIPTSREQVIQSLEGGIVADIAVREGDVVNAGDVLVRIDDTRAEASYRESHAKATALQAAIARLRAEVEGGVPKFPAEVVKDRLLYENEMQTWKARRRTLDESVAALQKSLALGEQELAITEPLSRKGLVSEVELLKARRQVNDLRLQMAEKQNRFRSDAATEMAKAEAELAQTEETVVSRQDTVRRTVLRAPMKGTIKNVQVTTRGGVIQPGTQILTLVPLEDRLLIETRIKPSDVAFLHIGLPATVKITAYDFSIFGGLKGKVINISPDTLRDDTARQAGLSPEDQAYYRVLVQTDSAELVKGKSRLPILPGMIANVEIQTGEKSVLDYLLKPVFKSREAMRER